MSNNQDLNQLTKESLKTALIQLLKDNEVEQISVTSLTQRAGVSRMAYYRNYQSITHLYHDVYDDYFQQFFQENKSPLMQRHGFNIWKGLFLFLYQHQDVAEILLSPKENHHFLAYLNEAFCLPLENLHDRYLMRGVIGSIFNILIEWVNDKFIYEPEILAELCQQLTQHIQVPIANLEKWLPKD
ncbi:TetR/AcrR family transcriptional regulator [Aerococcaceae bacterium zg-ZUI334]|uniref:TetR/AcrR family transcriptional regulator n=1 Tax=Aerococcaceae bacterium zg-252 TaxID=2796928 RepID=UPI001B9AA3B2|nr:TetR/AcrR family transcriptional regulator [Aerococcaceae bacterium zg-ZUI334]